MMNKPEPIRIGVTGFKADVYASDEPKINWQALIPLPKFQQFCVEQSKLPYGTVMEWIVSYLQNAVHQHGEVAFFQHYQQWHDEKGYWHNETVYGQLIGE